MRAILIVLFLAFSGCGSGEDFPEPSDSPVPSESPAPDVCLNEECTMLSQTRSPAQAGEGGSGGDWTSESNVVSSNNSYATAQRATNSVPTESIRSWDYGFSIPPHAIIRGIVVSTEIKADLDNGTHNPFVRSIKPSKVADTTSAEGAPGSDPDQIQDITTSDAVYSAPISDTAYLWSTTWTSAEINSSAFGMFHHVAASGGGASLVTFSCDHHSITVYYDLPGDLGASF